MIEYNVINTNPMIPGNINQNNCIILIILKYNNDEKIQPKVGIQIT